MDLSIKYGEVLTKINKIQNFSIEGLESFEKGDFFGLFENMKQIEGI